MRLPLGPRLGAMLMTVLAVLYVVTLGRQAVMLLGLGDPVALVIGIGLIVLPLLGTWGIVSELIFGFRSERLGRELVALDRVPEAELPLLPSGRVDRVAAEPIFDAFAAEVQADETDWTRWYRLALVYDACGDRRRARAAVRRAIALHRASAPVSGPAGSESRGSDPEPGERTASSSPAD